MVSSVIRKYFEQKVDKDYTGYLDNTKMNRLFKDTLYRVVNERIANLTTTKNYDELSFLIKTAISYTPTSNKVVLGVTPIVSVSIVNPAVYSITSGFDHNLTTGDSVIISGVLGTTNANGTYTATVTGVRTFQITVASAVGTNTPNTGSLYASKQISDYYRLLAVKTLFRGARTLNVTKALNQTPIRVTFTVVNNFRTGDQVFITGVGGNTNANGTFYIIKINSGAFDLYSDKNLTIPVSGNANYTSGGTIVVVRNEYATPLNSDRKISELAQASIDYPRYEESQHALNLYPSDYSCVTAQVDYITLPKEIDFTDTNTDYTLYYNDKFLFFLIDKAAENFSVQIRDPEGVQYFNKETQANR